MPLANPNASFEAAARHLFKHLDDARELRENPLVARFFVEPMAGRSKPAHAREALAFVRELIERGAENYRSASSVAALGAESANRRYAILTEHFLNRKELDRVAAELGISMRQCYRERTECMRTVATFVKQYEHAAETSVEWLASEYRLRMDRAAARAAIGDVDRSLSEYDEIIDAGPRYEYQIEALCKRADVLTNDGRFDASRATVQRAEKTLVARGAEGSLDPSVPAQIALVRSRLHWAVGDFREESRALGRVRQLLERSVPGQDETTDALFTDALLDACVRAQVRGEFSLAADHLRCAERRLAAMRAPSPRQRFDVTIESWNLGAGGIQYETASTGQKSRYAALAELACLSRMAPASSNSIRLAQSFMRYYAEVGEYDAAAEWAKRTIAMARKQPDSRVLAGAHLAVADWALGTPQWRRAESLLSHIDGVFHPGSADWIVLQGLHANFALMARRYDEAFSRATQTEAATGKMENYRFQAAARTTVALAAHGLGWRRQASEVVHSALDMVDRYGTTWTRHYAYRAAAEITGDRRYRQRARAALRGLGA